VLCVGASFGAVSDGGQVRFSQVALRMLVLYNTESLVAENLHSSTVIFEF